MFILRLCQYFSKMTGQRNGKDLEISARGLKPTCYLNICMEQLRKTTETCYYSRWPDWNSIRTQNTSVERSAVHPKTFPLVVSGIIILNEDVSEKPFTFIRIFSPSLTFIYHHIAAFYSSVLNMYVVFNRKYRYPPTTRGVTSRKSSLSTVGVYSLHLRTSIIRRKYRKHYHHSVPQTIHK